MPGERSVTASGFTVDWSASRHNWPALFEQSGMVGQPGLRFLEVGCFEGAATVWLLTHVLTDPTSTITVVDTFEGSPRWPPSLRNFEERFRANTNRWAEKVTVRAGRSRDVLPSLVGPFDFAYIDASHTSPDALADAVLAWPLVRAGGLMVFDDYEWREAPTELERPKVGIDAFLAVHADELTVLHVGAQVAVAKL